MTPPTTRPLYSFDAIKMQIVVLLTHVIVTSTPAHATSATSAFSPADGPDDTHARWFFVAMMVLVIGTAVCTRLSRPSTKDMPDERSSDDI